MGLFKLFNKDKDETVPVFSGANTTTPVQIPKQIFIEENLLQDMAPEQQQDGEVKGIAAVYTFLQADYGTKGYEDALINCEEGYMEDQIKVLTLDLAILIHKVVTFYEATIKLIDLHIEIRSRGGLINIVEELKVRKEIAQEHLSKLAIIKQDINNDAGLQNRVFLSYKQGFMKGLVYLTQTNILDKKL